MHKENLLMVLSHEVKDSFSRLGGYLHILKNNLITESENILLIDRLEEEFRENEIYMNDLLMWIKEKRNKKNEFVTIGITSLVNAVLHASEIKNIATTKRIKFIWDIPNAQINIDKTLYVIVLKNILKNALKFSGPNNNIFLNVELDQNKIVTHVKDQGMGISGNPSNIDQLPSKKAYSGEKGSGLALSLCHEILKLDGGEIWAKNNLNRGASFFFSLPFH